MPGGIDGFSAFGSRGIPIRLEEPNPGGKDGFSAFGSRGIPIRVVLVPLGSGEKVLELFFIIMSAAEGAPDTLNGAIIVTVYN